MMTAVAQMWQLYLRMSNTRRHGGPNIHVVIDKEDVAQMMSLLKKVRHVYGDPQNEENFIDDLGYTAMAGQFSAIVAPVGVVDEQHDDERRRNKVIE
jgi:hypothetical protein